MQTFPPLPQKSDDTSLECMTCLKNRIEQKKNMIEAKAQYFLEDKSLPQAITAQSPVIFGNGRRMAATIDRDGRSSHKSPYMCMEQTGGMVTDSMTLGNLSQIKGSTNHAEKQGSLSRREKDIEERINRIETFLKNQKA